MHTEDDVAILLTALAGAIIGVIVGYFAYAAAGPESTKFYYWIQSPWDYGGAWWGIGGAVTGALIGYIRSLERGS